MQQGRSQCARESLTPECPQRPGSDDGDDGNPRGKQPMFSGYQGPKAANRA
jgi:hypothetical protein